jgi:TrpR-related protein YerC/YecD
MHDFLGDLLTPDEIERLAARWQCMKLSTAGLTREEIKERVGVSLTTISRCRRAVAHGTGVIEMLVERLDESQETS